jgi:tetratricopeptide (TPR) repeat protein
MRGTREECRRFLDEWDDQAFEDVQLGRQLADEGLARVRALGNPPDLYARALANQGSSFRVTSDLSRAEKLYKEAEGLYRSLILSLDFGYIQQRQAILDQADLERRWAYLRRDQRRFCEALDRATAAESVFLAANDLYNVGRSRSVRGTIHSERGHQEEAIPWLSSALTCFEPGKHDEAIYAAAHNLQIALTESDPSPECLEETLRQVTEGRLSRTSRRPSRTGSVSRQLMGHRRRTLPDAKARGLQGRILALLHQYPDAQRLLESAREDLIFVDASLDAAVVDVELGECYLCSIGGHRRWDRIEELAKEAIELLAPVPGIPETLAALRLWQTAVVARSLGEARQRVRCCRVELLRPKAKA